MALHDEEERGNLTRRLRGDEQERTEAHALLGALLSSASNLEDESQLSRVLTLLTNLAASADLAEFVMSVVIEALLLQWRRATLPMLTLERALPLCTCLRGKHSF